MVFIEVLIPLPGVQVPGVSGRRIFAYLDEANVRAFLAKALAADVEAVLSDQTGAVSADAAAYSISQYSSRLFPPSSSTSLLRMRFPPSTIPILKGCIETGSNAPSPGSLAVGPRTRVPDVVVRHDCGVLVVGRLRASR
jgi:hypothetical protein